MPSARTQHVREVTSGAVDDVLRVSERLLKLGIVVRRVSVSADGALTVDVGAYEDPDAPATPHEPGRPKVRSYRELVLDSVPPDPKAKPVP